MDGNDCELFSEGMKALWLKFLLAESNRGLLKSSYYEKFAKNAKSHVAVISLEM